jgi:hypothetical protein
MTGVACIKKEKPRSAGQVPGLAYVRTALEEFGGVGADQLALLKSHHTSPIVRM